jgi:hypothetical protein
MPFSLQTNKKLQALLNHRANAGSFLPKLAV